MKNICYKLFQGEKTDGSHILVDVTMEHNDANMELAEKEAYLGEITIEEVEDDAQNL